MRKLTEKDIVAMIGKKNIGYTVIKAKVKIGRFTDSDNYGYVLAVSERGNYVTWQFHLLEDETPDYYWGHYWNDDKEKAFQDYLTRD